MAAVGGQCFLTQSFFLALDKAPGSLFLCSAGCCGRAFNWVRHFAGVSQAPRWTGRLVG